jgi:hypothetical protein
MPGQEPLVAVRFPLVNGDLLADVGRGRRMMLSFKLRNNADWRQPFMLPTTNLTDAALRLRLGTLDLSTSNGRIIIDDPTVGAFSFVVPAADLSSVQPGHYRVDLLVFQPGKVKTVFTGSIDVVAGETTPAQ